MKPGGRGTALSHPPFFTYDCKGRGRAAFRVAVPRGFHYICLDKRHPFEYACAVIRAGKRPGGDDRPRVREALLSDLGYWVGFNRVHGIGPHRLRALLDYFGDIESAWHAPADALRRAGLDRRSLENLLTTRSTLSLDDEIARIERAGVQVLTWESPDYPRNLLQIYDPPPVLYVRGELTPEDEWAVAVVGTRRASAYGREAARRLSEDLARNRVTVVSGLARGIDAVAHRAALEAGGRTIAVLGSGVDVIYPPEHRRLAQSIAENGAILSEYPLGTRPEGGNFPPRNRIISGLSKGVIIVEAGVRSGALITADFAAEQGRDVFAVPGSIFQRGSVGTNRLIQEGAHPVLSASDVLEALNLEQIAEQAEMRAVVPSDPAEERLMAHLGADPVHVDDLAQAAGLPISVVSSTLALMELKGMVRQVGGMNYVLARETGVEYRID
ncbi:MAG: DNA-protecting protein DprA [Chloroflexi bacterium]|nr:DNA-protecting protein DprA [Chloroflexota bacterium]